jgi:MscS family membrane protein
MRRWLFIAAMSATLTGQVLAQPPTSTSSDALGSRQSSANTAKSPNDVQPTNDFPRDLAADAADFFDKVKLDDRVESIWTQNTWRQGTFFLITTVAGVILGRVISGVLRFLGNRLVRRGWELRGQVFLSAAAPACLALIATGLSLGIRQLALDPMFRAAANTVAIGLLLLIALFWYAYNLVDAVEIFLRRFAQRTESPLDNQVVPLLRRSMRLVLITVGVLTILEVVFGANVGAVLAGFGIAGLAVSLAAQDSLKNLFGSITIFFDKPFQVGDRIIFQGVDGNVEEIGFRSTKVRTLVGNLVTIPNSAIVNEKVENVGRRPTIQRVINLTLAYDTPPEKIEEAIHIVRRLLNEEGIREPIHPRVGANDSPPRVFFNELKSDALNLFVIYWYAPPDWWPYMEHAQRVNLEILRRFTAAGIEFAFPTRTIQFAGNEPRELSVRLLNSGDAFPS